MPWKARPACRQPQCPNLQPCPVHPPQGRWAGRGTSVERGYGYAWQQRRTQALIRDGGRCACGRVAQQVDHRIPRAQGGSDELENLVSICKSCHDAKTGREGQARH
jgi:5-methylcytosine-specific restriction protein A